MAFIDIHTHFLPGLDDGPRSLEDTIEMLRMAHAGGTRGIVATPHVFMDSFRHVTVPLVQSRFAETTAALAEQASQPGFEFLGEMEFYLGAENYFGASFLQALEEDRALTLNQSRYLLVEFNLNLPPPQFCRALERIQQAGLAPVLAHVERYEVVRSDPEMLRRALETGCLTQVNASSFDGSFWSKTRRLAFDLVEKDLVSIVASDSHGADYRPPQMMEAYLKLSDRFGADRAEALFSGHPKWVLTR